MNDVITIENTEMQIREYNGERVVTFKDIDMVHGNKSGTARRNFGRNKKHFIEGEDYFSLIKEKPNGTICPIRNITVPNKGIKVLTESGYLLIAKSFTDDLSWKVQRQLVNAYFKVREVQKEPYYKEPLAEDFTPRVPIEGKGANKSPSILKYSFQYVTIAATSDESLGQPIINNFRIGNFQNLYQRYTDIVADSNERGKPHIFRFLIDDIIHRFV